MDELLFAVGAFTLGAAIAFPQVSAVAAMSLICGLPLWFSVYVFAVPRK